MTRFSDAALLKGNFAHMAAEFRAGKRAAPESIDWQSASCDNSAEEAAQDVAKHIFALQQQIDEKKDRIEVLAFCAVGMMRVVGLVPGEADLIRVDGVLPDGKPAANLIHTSQLSLTFVTAPLDETVDDDGLEIGFLIFDELKSRKKQRSGKAQSKKTRSSARKPKKAASK